MLQEIGSKVFHNEYYLYPPKDDDMVFVFNEDKLLIREKGDGLLRVRDIKDAQPLKESLMYLYCVDNISAYMWKDDVLPEIEGFKYENVRQMRNISDEESLYYIFTAWHLYKWYSDNRFCGKCGGKTEYGDSERSLVCKCGNTIYPKIAPAVIVGVRNNDKLLMTHYADRPVKSWALIAGFVEFGEEIEDTVRREVMEEAGLKVKNITYYKSQPWGIDQNLLLGFYCDVDGDDTIKIDKKELAEGVWMPREEIPTDMPLFSLTATMIENFRKGEA